MYMYALNCAVGYAITSFRKAESAWIIVATQRQAPVAVKHRPAREGTTLGVEALCKVTATIRVQSLITSLFKGELFMVQV